MKKMRGFVDPISLTFILVMGIAAMGSQKQPELDQNTAQVPTDATVPAHTTQAPSKLVVSK